MQQKLSATQSLQLRYCQAFGGGVVRSNFPLNPNGNLVYLEYHLH